MITITKNISGSSAVVLIDSESTHEFSTMSMANVHATDAAAIDLYITDGTNTYYFFKGLSLPAGSSIILDRELIEFPKITYSLYVKLGAGSSTVDIIIRH